MQLRDALQESQQKLTCALTENKQLTANLRVSAAAEQLVQNIVQHGRQTGSGERQSALAAGRGRCPAVLRPASRLCYSLWHTWAYNVVRHLTCLT